ncbi:hypothetical protein [Prevotella intermedia]|uniref:Uncharacterized protein n=1 Tax=Prevotella intermedia TaxID=28131 RepID=A0A2D3NDS8_PREIN|nr:hypothetical protein [Prevotella intermedia]ATV53583.1 hypothetical protein CTM50_11455 [Prevotella intermedia]
MKRLILGLFAMGMLAIAPATSVASNNNIVVANCPEGVKKVDPQAFTDKLVKELKLDKKQAKALLKLNTDYADVADCPHAKKSCKKAEGNCKQAGGDCKKAASDCKQGAGDCKKGEAKKCDKQGNTECKGEGKRCDKQGNAECKGGNANCSKQAKAECKGENANCNKQGNAECKGKGAQCDKQKMAERSQHVKDMKARRTAYLAELKKILNDKQYQQYLNM